MTGGQDVTGLLDVPSLTRALEAEGRAQDRGVRRGPRALRTRGARWAAGVEVLGRDRLPEVQERLRNVPGVTVIVYDQRCAAEARRLRKRGLLAEPPRRVVINEAVCEGCGDCSAKSNCLSVLPLETEFGEKRHIHDPSCNRDYTCLEGDCPSFVTMTPQAATAAAGRRPRHRPRSAAGPPLPAGALPTPPDAGRSTAVRHLLHGHRWHRGGHRQPDPRPRRPKPPAWSSGAWTRPGSRRRPVRSSPTSTWPVTASDLGSPVISAGGADLYLSGDILQAASEKHLDKVAPGPDHRRHRPRLHPHRGHAADRRRSARTGRRCEQAIVDRVGPDRAAFVDSKRIAEAAARQPPPRQRRAARRRLPARGAADGSRPHRGGDTGGGGG